MKSRNGLFRIFALSLFIGIFISLCWVVYKELGERRFQKQTIILVKKSLEQSLPQELPRRFDSDPELLQLTMTMLLEISEVSVKHSSLDEDVVVAQIEIKTISPQVFEPFIDIIADERSKQHELSNKQVVSILKSKDSSLTIWRTLFKTIAFDKQNGQWVPREEY